MSPVPRSLVLLAAGLSTRYGRSKQLEPLGPGGHALLDYALYDALRGGFSRFLVVIQPRLEADFDRHLAPAREAGLDIRFVHQRLGDPDLIPLPGPGRTAPWGTGFALLTARAQVPGPFAVCNADDFYGRDAFGVLGRALGDVDREDGQGPLEAPPAFAVGYRLGATLSDKGGVSRGLLAVSEDGWITGVTEALELNADGAAIVGHDPAGRRLTASTSDPVSMNLWGFDTSLFPLLEEGFRTFVEGQGRMDGEFYLTEAVNRLLAEGRLRARLLKTDGAWFGITFPGDRPAVATALGNLVDSGVYPRDLWGSPAAWNKER